MQWNLSKRNGTARGARMADLMNLRELAAYLRLERQTLYNWLHQRKLSGIKMGGVWRFHRDEIDRWLSEQTIRATPRKTSHTAPRHKPASYAPALNHRAMSGRSRTVATLATQPTRRDA